MAAPDDSRPLMQMNAGPGKPGPARSWQEIAEHLFALLDDIDTASDMFKPDQDPFYRYVMRKAGERFDVATSDGHNLTFNVRE